MENINQKVKIIIVLVQHPVFGPLLIPYTAKDNPDGTVLLLEQAFHIPEELLKEISPAERKVIDLACSFSEKKLMTVYSKEKTVSSFLKKVSEETIKSTIRPFIEKKLREMTEVICISGIPLYQNKPGNKKLYPHSSYQISQHTTEVTFDFEADDTHFRYGIAFRRNGEIISLLDKKPVISLVSSPAVLLAGDELHVFRDIQATRILPFTNKSQVSVDVSQIDKYIENIVLPIIRYHEVNHKGLPIIQEERSLQAVISLEDSIYDKPVLQVLFTYGKQTFYPGKTALAKYATIHEEDGKKVIRFFYRDLELEKTLIRELENTGLRLFTDSYYSIRDDSQDQSLSGWINRNKAFINENFRMLNGNKNVEYCFDEISISQDITEDNDWFELHITVSIGDFRIPFIRFRKNILGGIREYALPDGKIILLPEEWFAKYADMFVFSEKNEETIKLKRSFVGIVSDVLEKDAPKKTSYQTKTWTEVPKKLKATLRHYQKDGFNWMVHLNKNKLGGCLADDMGLGKTLQTLTLLQHIYKSSDVPALRNRNENTDGKGQLSLFGESEEPQTDCPASLIVMPTSLLHNWKREIRKFTTLSEYEYGGGTHLKGESIIRVFDRFHLIITSYGIMRNYIDELSKYRFEYIVLDESQNIKNSESLTFKAATRLQSYHKLILTGTPIENSLKDLWSQFRFIQPDLLGTESYYQQHYITPVRQGDVRAEKRLAKLISPLILRRNKREVAPELPSLTEEFLFCDMTDEQKELYKREKNGLRNLLLAKESRNNLNVLNGIMLLRQLASHPAMVSADFTGSSGKLEEIISMFETLQSEGHKVLIFSSFVKHLEIVADAFSRKNWKYAMLTGSTLNREHEIEQFNKHDDIRAFLISLKAGGVGLNLTQADYVFIIDPWWNPAAEIQAISRAHRIGQDKQVFAYRFITMGSIEEKIIRLQESKRKLSETFITESNPFEALTDEEWANLLEV